MRLLLQNYKKIPINQNEIHPGALAFSLIIQYFMLFFTNFAVRHINAGLKHILFGITFVYGL